MNRDPALAVPVLRALSRAVYTRAIYPPDHPAVSAAGRHLLEALGACLGELGSEDITFLVVDRELLFEGRPLRSHNLQLAPFVRTMNRLGIERLTLASGLERGECHRLIDGLAGCGETVSSAHASVGRIRLAEEVDGGESLAPPSSGPTEILEQEIDDAEDAFLSFDTDPGGSVEELDRMLWRLVEGLDQTSRELLLLGPMKGFDQLLFVHSINVALLTMVQARALGIADQALHDIGLAALFHDIGKLSLPRSLVENRGRLTDKEWAIAQLHPELGAAKLCGLPGIPHLAVLVAYEHHLRWDGKPSFPVPATPRVPNLASQLTAIADTYDVMIAGRGLARGVGREAALEVWRERAETHLDPFLVASFILTLSGTEAAGGSSGDQVP